MTQWGGEEDDAIGNPLTYRDGITFTWQNGRELATLIKDGNTISYTYDSDGIRTENNGGTVTKYFYDESNNLISLIQGNTQLVFYYDADGQADSFVVYSGDTETRYYYVKNLQSDVTKIMSADGTVVANYYYDAYGKLLSTTNAEGVEITDTTSVAFLNPLRYRGYVYDSDTGLYYLQSRYYDPETCRFINADAYAFNGHLGANLFAYVNNSPVMYEDATGYAVYTLPTGPQITPILKLSKSAFRKAVDTAATCYLNSKGYYISSELFHHGLYGKGKRISAALLNKMSAAILKTPEVKKNIRDWYKYLENRKNPVNKIYKGDKPKLNIEFKTGDLYYGIHEMSVKINVLSKTKSKRQGTIYEFNITFSDDFDFTKIWKEKSLGAFANNLGYRLTKSNTLIPFAWSITKRVVVNENSYQVLY